MGVRLRDIVSGRKVDLSDLSGRALAVDAYNVLYQFLSVIRGYDGTPLKDRSGRVTSHLSGLLYRTARLMEAGVKPIYVFDGVPPALKRVEVERRVKAREEARFKYEKAKREGRLEEARVYAQASARLRDYMVDGSKRLLDFMGVPWIQAPSEGEAQAAYLAVRGDVWAAASQDYDSLLFGAPRLIRNVAITGRRKLPRKKVYITVKPEVVELGQVLGELGISREQLVALGILVGTDFNPEGIRGVGPKTALKLVKKHKTLDGVVENLKEAEFPVEPGRIADVFLNPDVTDDYAIRWREPRAEGVIGFLCGEHNFSEERVRKALEKMSAGYEEMEKKATLEKWFKQK
ncbi:MAG: flap endonuclease-1 [Candidatus Bathyarchaeota archaeon]|nr:flap endonuclease-1 [Candidatus Bathyarchaeota archaeon]